MCVVKEVDLGTLTPQEKQEAWNEASILQNLEPYPNVIDYFEAHLDAEGGEKLSLVLEYADNGDLATQVLRRMALLDRQNDTHEVARSTLPGNPRKLCESPFFQEKHVMLVFVQCLFGLHHLHKNSIMHRDIKTHNILLFSNGLVKLGDFGVAKSFKRTQVRKSCVGSPLYMAPEIHSSKGYTYKADIWSLGCVLHELCCLKHPYTGNNVIQLVMKVTNAPPPTSLDVPPRTYAVDLLHLINRMLQKDPDSRPSTAEIIRMPFVYKYSELLASRYKILHHFKQILEEYKGTLRDLPPASPCLEATNMRWQDPEVKTLTEEELFPSAGGAMQTGVAEHEHTQKQGDSPEGRLASATKVHNLEYGTNTLGKLNEGAVGIVADLPWKSPATEAHNFGHAPLDDDLAVVIPDSPLKPADPHYNQNALLGDRELHFLLDALMPNAGPVSGGNDCPLRKVSSLISSASQNAHFFDEIPSVNGAATQATLKDQMHPQFIHKADQMKRRAYYPRRAYNPEAQVRSPQPQPNLLPSPIGESMVKEKLSVSGQSYAVEETQTGNILRVNKHQ
ncbi:NEK kinase, putative [Eimeria praecox]|uniref:non-specific serine/threonine protein kinase n=1 Tax=Eimeria praecox TaxID=51316 RepID=U6GSB7_9EIME|nr:NEK kinase, putative [Eimeria praecox]